MRNDATTPTTNGGRLHHAYVTRFLRAAAAAAIGAALLLAGCGGNAGQGTGTGGSGTGGSETGAGGGSTGQPNVVVYQTHVEPMVFWDPSDGFSNEIIAMNNMYETLLRYDPTTNSFKNVLATGYESSDDALTWTFHLRENVKFHTGKTMTSADVKASFERTIAHAQGAAYILDAVDTIDTPDPQTVVFHLKYAAPMDLIVSSPYAAYVFDTDPLKANGDDWFNQHNESGTGPYMLKSWTENDSLVMTKFDDYWGGWKDGQFDTAIIRTVPEASTATQMIQAGQLDVVEQLPFEQLEALQDDPNVKLVKTPSYQNLIAFFNVEKAPLDNPKVREALAWSFPYESVVQNVMHGNATQARGPIPVGLWGHDDSLAQYKEDLDKAKSLLEEAGLGDGGLTLTLTYTAGDENERRTVELWSAELAKLGIRLDGRAMPWDAQWSLAKSTDPNDRQDIFMMYWWPDYATPYSFLFNLFHSEDAINFNMSYYRNAAYDDLIDRGNELAATDRDQAVALFGQAQEQLMKDNPAVFIYDQSYVRPVAASLSGYVDNPAYPNVVFFYDLTRK